MLLDLQVSGGSVWGGSTVGPGPVVGGSGVRVMVVTEQAGAGAQVPLRQRTPRFRWSRPLRAPPTRGRM